MVEVTWRLGERFDARRAGRVSCGEFDATVQGWIAHVRYADSWGRRARACAEAVCVVMAAACRVSFLNAAYGLPICACGAKKMRR